MAFQTLLVGLDEAHQLVESGGWAITEPQIGAALSSRGGNLRQARPSSRAWTA